MSLNVTLDLIHHNTEALKDKTHLQLWPPLPPTPAPVAKVTFINSCISGNFPNYSAPAEAQTHNYWEDMQLVRNVIHCDPTHAASLPCSVWRRNKALPQMAYHTVQVKRAFLIKTFMILWKGFMWKQLPSRCTQVKVVTSESIMEIYVYIVHTVLNM